MKHLTRLFSTLLIVGMIFSFVQPGVTQAREIKTDLTGETNDKIESNLLDKFSTDGSADFIVEYSEQADLSPAYKMSWSERGWFVYNKLTEVAESSQAKSKAQLDGLNLRYQTFINGNELYVWNGNISAAQSLAGLPEVEFIRATRTYTIDPVVNSANPLFSATWAGDLLANNTSFDVTPDAITDWGITDTKADQFWDSFGFEGDGIVVANIDTGVDYTHIALNGNYKCADNPSSPECWLDPAPTNCTGPGGGPCDTIYSGIYHGSHTMGTMVAENDPSLQYIAGMAPNAQWIACMGCPSGSCPDFDLNSCADWLIAPGGNPDARPNIVNNSWGGSGGNTFYMSKVLSWRASGIFPAFSAGNGYNCSTLGSPGDYQESFGSASHQVSRVISDFSSKGPSAVFGHEPYTKPNISAPGEDIFSTQPGNGWVSISGTSMASPHSAGAVALLWSCNPSLIGQMDQTFEILQNSADTPPAGSCGAPPDGEGNNTYGYGYLDMMTIGQQYCVSAWGGIDGHVYDAVTNDPITDVSVTGYRQAGGSWDALSDGSGYYTMTVGAGTYTVEAVHPQYTSGSVSGLQVLTDTVVTQDFYLQPRGHLFGYVTDQDSGIPLEATVSVAEGPIVLTDPVTGFYEFYLDPGTYDVTASAPDYADETATVVLDVGDEVQQDFALLAAIAVVPDPVSITLEMGQTGVVPELMTNNMDVPYPFEFKEKQAVERLMAGEDILVVSKDLSAAIAMETALDNLGVTYLDVSDGVFQTMTVEDLLQFQAVFYAGITGTSGTPTASETLLMAYLDAGGQLYISDNDLGYYRHGSIFYDTYLQSTYLLDNGGELLVGEDMMTGLNPDVTTDPYPDSFNVGAEGTRIFKWSTADNAGGVLVERGAYKAIYTSFDFQNLVSAVDATELIDRIVSLYLSSDIPWFGTSIISGTVPAGETIGWTNAFSATMGSGISQPGEYFGLLRIVPVGDPSLPDKVINLHMTVEPSLTFGQIEGTVTSDRPGGPMQASILIEASDGTTVTLTTDPGTGYYSYWLEEGTYDVTASADGYVAQTAPVLIVGQLTTIQDFELLLDAAWIVPDPTSLETTLVMGDQSTQLLNIGNIGQQDLTFNISEIPGEFIPGEAANQPEALWPGPDGYGYQGDEVNYSWVDIAATGTAVLLGDDSYSSAIPLGFEFPLYDTTYTDMYIASNGYLAFGSGSSVLTNQCPLPNASTPNNIIPILWDDLDPGDTNDPAYYQGFANCPVGSGACMVAQYQNYHHYQSGGGGPLAGTFEAILFENGSVMMQYLDAGVEEGSGSTTGVEGNNAPADYGLTYACDTASSLHDSLAMCYSYPDSSGCGAGDVPWVMEEPVSGTVPAPGTQPVDVTFDSSVVTQPGTYTASLRVHNNDPFVPAVTVNLTMNVLPTATLGVLEGHVTSDRPGGALIAEITIESSGGMTWTVPTDADGFYSLWLEQGDYSVTAVASGYLPQTDQVTIVANTTTTQDFTLLLDAPWIDVTPPSLEQTLQMGESAMQTVEITNNGQAPLTYEIVERNGGFTPSLAGEDVLVVRKDTTAATAMENALTALGYTYLGVTDAEFQAMPVEDLLEYSAVFYAGATGSTGNPTPSEVLLMVYLDEGGSLFISDNDLGYYRHGSVFYDTYLQAIYDVDNGGDYLDGLDLMAGLTLDLTADPYPDGISVAADGTSIFQFQGSTEMGGVALDRNGYRAIYTAFDYQNIADPAQEVEVINRVLGYIAISDAPWLAESPITGTIGAGEMAPVDVTFNSSVVNDPGTYTAVLKVKHNDPLSEVVTIPVTMNVTPSADMGRLEGAITSLGYCDNESISLEAEVLIENSTGMTWTVTTDENGLYFLWLPADTYAVTASAPGHLDASGEATVVGQQTTVLDLALRSIQPCMEVDPTTFAITLPVDTQYTETLSIINNGAGALTWELRETTATLKILDQEVIVNIPPISAPDTPIASRGVSKGYPARSFGMHIGQVSAEPINVLLVTPDAVGGGDISLLLNTLAAFPDLVVTVWDGNAGTPTVADMQAYDVVFVGNDILWTSSSIDKTALSNTMADFIDAGGKLLVANFIWSYDEWGFLGGRFIDEDYSPFEISTADIWNPATLGSYDPDSPLMAGITSVSDAFGHQDPNLSTSGAWVASWNDGENFVAVSPDVVGLNQEYFHNADFGGQTGELLHNALLYLGAAQEWVDVPWVTEVPTNGITLPDSTFDVDVVFDTTGLTAGECYTASLGLIHDDAGQSNPYFIPLNLCIVVPVYGVDVEPEVSAQSGSPGETVSYLLHITNTGDVPDTILLSVSNVEPGWVVETPASFDLAAGQSTEAIILVTIPAGAVNADFDTFTLTATSSGDPEVFDEVVITTTAVVPMHYIYLPLIMRK